MVGRLVGRIDTRVLITFGFALLAYTCWWLGNLNLEIATRNVMWPNVFSGVAMGFIFVPLTTATMGSLSNEQMGNGAGIFNLMRNIGGSIGISMATTMVVRGTQIHQAQMVAHLTPYNAPYQHQLSAMVAALRTRPIRSLPANRPSGCWAASSCSRPTWRLMSIRFAAWHCYVWFVCRSCFSFAKYLATAGRSQCIERITSEIACGFAAPIGKVAVPPAKLRSTHRRSRMRNCCSASSLERSSCPRGPDTHAPSACNWRSAASRLAKWSSPNCCNQFHQSLPTDNAATRGLAEQCLFNRGTLNQQPAAIGEETRKQRK